MIRRFASLAMASLFATGATAASELAPGSGYSIHLGRFNGAVHYTVEPDGYRVVVTLASGAEGQPIRFISVLGPGQRVVISVPRALRQPSIDFTVMREGEALRVGDNFAAPVIGTVTEASVEETVGR